MGDGGSGRCLREWEKLGKHGKWERKNDGSLDLRERKEQEKRRHERGRENNRKHGGERNRKMVGQGQEIKGERTSITVINRKLNTIIYYNNVCVW